MSGSDLEFTVGGTLRHSEPVELPERLDVLVAGAGPAGTAAALRAKELGLSCLVVDTVEIMKRIRDYPKSKPILPNYGGGDDTPFPEGGEWVAKLAFEAIDKDDLADRYAGLYREAGLPVKVGCELQDIQREGEDWEVSVWNHRTQAEERHRARSVVLAIGAGVQRRLDVPGDCEGVLYNLRDAQDFVGQPTLVIGGGTSAAEAVLAISQAKADADDATYVYWSYRGRSMPSVSKALADAFFDAYVRNGNIQYLRLSDAAAIVTGPDKEDYLSVRVDRRCVEGRPVETLHYEFPKKNVIACIGADPPVKLLRKLGIQVPEVKSSPRMLVDGRGQTSQPEVYLTGFARGMRFFVCEDFEDKSTFKTLSVKQNIKMALGDGVLAVDSIAARLSGETPATKPAPPAVEKTAVLGPEQSADETVLPGVEPPVGPPPDDTNQRVPLLQVLRPDGEEEESHPLRGELTELGRKCAGISFEQDEYLEPVHAVLRLEDGQMRLLDHGSRTGTWIRVDAVDGRRLEEGDQVWLSRQLMVVRRGGQGSGWQVEHRGSSGENRGLMDVPAKGVMIGRASEWPLDPRDTALSKRHCQLLVDGEGLRVVDRGSSNGTYLRVRESLPLRPGDELRLGTQRLRYSRGDEERVAPDEITVVPTEDREAAAGEPRPEAPAAEPAVQAPAGGGAREVTLESEDGTLSFPVEEGQTVLDAYIAAGNKCDEPLGYQCKMGVCGFCVVELPEGDGGFEAHDPGSPEMKTIETACGLSGDPTQYRLACQARIQGPVKVCMPE